MVIQISASLTPAGQFQFQWNPVEHFDSRSFDRIRHAESDAMSIRNRVVLKESYEPHVYARDL